MSRGSSFSATCHHAILELSAQEQEENVAFFYKKGRSWILAFLRLKSEPPGAESRWCTKALPPSPPLPSLLWFSIVVASWIAPAMLSSPGPVVAVQPFHFLLYRFWWSNHLLLRIASLFSQTGPVSIQVYQWQSTFKKIVQPHTPWCRLEKQSYSCPNFPQLETNQPINQKIVSKHFNVLNFMSFWK